MLRLDQISVVFSPGTSDENTALRKVGLEVGRGDFITIIGSNGAGKSTLFNVIAGSVAPTSGSVILDGQDITRQKEYQRAARIGRIFQDPLLGTAGRMSLEDNMMICSRKGWRGLRISLDRRMRERFREQLRRLDMGLEDRLADNVSQLSGGQRQALTLLMAVMSRPDLLLLDEHTAALDPANAALVMELTRSFASEYGLTVMMVTHNMQQALDYGNRLVMMDGGEVIMDIGGGEKAGLTLDSLAQRFRQIKRRSLDNDRMVLQ